MAKCWEVTNNAIPAWGYSQCVGAPGWDVSMPDADNWIKPENVGTCVQINDPVVEPPADCARWTIGLITNNASGVWDMGSLPDGSVVSMTFNDVGDPNEYYTSIDGLAWVGPIAWPLGDGGRYGQDFTYMFRSDNCFGLLGLEITLNNLTELAVTRDGTTWVEHTLSGVDPVNQIINALVYAEGLGEYWVFCRGWDNETSAWKTSDDILNANAAWTEIAPSGMTWIGATHTLRGDWHSVAWSEVLNLFVLAINTTTTVTIDGIPFRDAEVYTSPNGTTWTRLALPNLWRVMYPEVVAISDGVLLVPVQSLTDTTVDGPTWYNSSDGKTKRTGYTYHIGTGSVVTRRGQLPGPSEVLVAYYHDDNYQGKLVYDAATTTLVLTSMSASWVGEVVSSMDDGATWIKEPVGWVPADPTSGYPRGPDAYAMLLGTGKAILGKDDSAADWPATVLFDPFCI